MLGITPEKLFRAPGQIRVLRVLWNSWKPLTGRQVQKLAGLANLSTMQSLKRLTDIGVVSCRRAGRSYQYELKRDCWAVRDLVSPVFEREDRGLDLLCEDLEKRLTGQCRTAYLYGSALDTGRDSVGDLDLFLVVKKEADRLELESSLIPEISKIISERFSLFLEPNIVTSEELSRNSLKKMAKKIAETGRKICGRKLDEVISG